jgi:hypothetical protein
MRLINVATQKLENFIGYEIPPYAILSHTWEDEEVEFTHWQSGNYKQRKGYDKISYTCIQAKSHGLGYVWVDTCCIDKSSSSELSEAINSMFRWYKHAWVCYAYLSDMDLEAEDYGHWRFEKSRWFTRGWTLQELLAPSSMMFFDRSWNPIGCKESLLPDIVKITGINMEVLRDSDYMYEMSISTRMSWAARRETTRIEDIAYCLFGIFNLNMPLLYGEGVKAFVRLQEELLRTSNDHTLFAWGHEPDIKWNARRQPLHGNMFASFPSAFANGAKIDQFSNFSASDMSLNNEGLHLRLPIAKIEKWEQIFPPEMTVESENPPVLLDQLRIALLECRSSSLGEHFLGILLVVPYDSSIVDNGGKTLFVTRATSANGVAIIPVPASIAAYTTVHDLSIQWEFKRRRLRGPMGQRTTTDIPDLRVIDARSIKTKGYSLQLLFGTHLHESTDDDTIYYTETTAYAIMRLTDPSGKPVTDLALRLSAVRYSGVATLKVPMDVNTYLVNAPKLVYFGRTVVPTKSTNDKDGDVICAEMTHKQVFRWRIPVLRFTLEQLPGKLAQDYLNLLHHQESLAGKIGMG